jgi:hypothetical protein
MIYTTILQEQARKNYKRLEFLATDPEVWVQFPALPGFLRSSGPGTGTTQPCEND